MFGIRRRLPTLGDLCIIGGLMCAAGLIWVLSGGRKRW